MLRVILLWAYVAGLTAATAVRLRYGARRRAKVLVRHRSLFDVTLVGLAGVGMVAPLVRLFSPWIDFADYAAPDWSAVAGTAVFAAGIVLLGKAHADLGPNWSATPHIHDGQDLVTHGVYARVRHPMYAAYLLWGLGQSLMLRNWVAGPMMLASFAVLCVIRIPAEERLMEESFGDEYRAYARRTGRLIPKPKS